MGVMETTSNPPPSPPLGSRALVAEDERALADLLGSYLERDGFEVTKTFDGLSAVTMAASSTRTCWSSTSGCPGWTASRCADRSGRSPTPTS